MLYDPKKFAPKPTRAGFISWLETKDPNERYEYLPACNCAIGQYLVSTGTSYAEKICEMQTEFMHWNCAITAPEPWTFGAALARAKALQS